MTRVFIASLLLIGVSACKPAETTPVQQDGTEVRTETTSEVAVPAGEPLRYGMNQIVGKPEVIGEPSASLVGIKVKVVLKDVGALPAAGTILLPREGEEAPLAGKIRSATTVPEGVLLEVETVPVTELYKELKVETTGTTSSVKP